MIRRDLQALNEYYRSQTWAEKRTERLKIDGFRCAKCGFIRALEVHHINYERFGHEDVSRDLITLCKKCHKEIETQKSIQDSNFAFELLPEGTYHFAVKSHTFGYSNSAKLPPNTQTVDYRLEIPYYKGKELKTALITKKLFVCKKTLFVIRQFVECIRMIPENGRRAVDLNAADGGTGICALTILTTQNGNLINSVNTFYTPSKYPLHNMNDDAWHEYINLKED